MTILYIQIRKNKMIVRDPEIRQEVSDASQIFSNSRLLVADFFRAEKVLFDLTRRFLKRKWFRFKQDTLIIHALEMNEGGLSVVEVRVLQEITAVSAPKADLIVLDDPRVLNDSEVIDKAKEKR
ncbi:hypothetical protein JHU04_000859 [Brenneria sp. 4F2]|nr:hypothetical protein [Brenneria bubanii]